MNKKRFLEIYLPSITLTFTAVILCTSVLNLIQGYEGLSYRWILQLCGYILVVEAVDVVLGKIEFRSYLGYFLTEAVISYGCMLAFGYFGNWFSFTAGTLFTITVMFFLIFGAVHTYFFQRAKSNADEINQMLQEKE